MLKAFSHVMMFATDLGRAVDWYCEKLGFDRKFVHLPHYASLHHPLINTRLDIHPTEAGGKDVGHGPMPYFAVIDLDEFLTQLKAKDVKTGEPKREGDSPRFCTIWDSEGNAVGLEEVA